MLIIAGVEYAVWTHPAIAPGGALVITGIVSLIVMMLGFAFEAWND